MNMTYQNALDAILAKCPSLTGHPCDHARIVYLFKRLTEEGKFSDSPDEIGNYLKKKGLPASKASEIQGIYEVFEIVQKQNCPWNEEFLNNLIEI